MRDQRITCSVGDIAAPTKNSLVGGPFGSNLVSADYVSSGVPVIRGENMGKGRWVEGTFAHVTAEKAESLSANLARPGDLVFTQRGTLGQVAIVPVEGPERYLISQSQMKLTPDPAKADVLFLYYAFMSPQQQDHIRRNAIQTGVPHTNLGILRDTPLDLPPIEDQRAIASVLGALDDMIELNRSMNETLEAIARAIFKSWFVDFDPVKAKAVGRNPAGLSVDMAQIFPSKLDLATGLPVGWKSLALSDVCTTQYGYTASATDVAVGPKFLRVMDINKADWIDWSPVPQCKIDENEFDRYRLRYGDIVVARMADPGKSALIVDEVPAVFASYLVRLKTASLAQSFYVYGFLKSDLYHEYVAGARSGSVQSNMNAQVIVGTSIVWPPEPVLDAFLRTMEPIRKKIALNLRESTTLSGIRDALLPKLISGKVRLKDAEKIVEAHA